MAEPLSGLEQVTWMDVRIDKELPTPRHGKPEEIRNRVRTMCEKGEKMMKNFIYFRKPGFSTEDRCLPAIPLKNGLFLRIFIIKNCIVTVPTRSRIY